MSVSKISCPNCGGVACLIRRAEPVATVGGAVTGGLVGYGSATAVAVVGALLLGPVGALAGATATTILSVIVGAASGGAAGNSVGKVVDESVIGQYRCIKCGQTFKV